MSLRFQDRPENLERLLLGMLTYLHGTEYDRVEQESESFAYLRLRFGDDVVDLARSKGYIAGLLSGRDETYITSKGKQFIRDRCRS